MSNSLTINEGINAAIHLCWYVYERILLTVTVYIMVAQYCGSTTAFRQLRSISDSIPSKMSIHANYSNVADSEGFYDLKNSVK